MKVEGSPSGGPAPYPGNSWLVVWLLAAAYLLSMLDRTILSLMVEPIQRDLGISDTQFGLLQGLAFAIFYSIAGLPIGWLVDRAPRRLIVVVGVSFWSLMTAASGLAQSYLHLFLARIGVGAGEASLNPSAYSMLADIFPKERLGRAVAAFSTGATVGTGLAFLFGGALVQVLSAQPNISVPVLGELRVWQLGFFLAGAPGLVLALLILLLVPEPQRPSAPAADQQTWKSVFATIRRRWSAYGLMTLGFCCVTLMTYATLGWGPAMFQRVRGFSPGEAGMVMAAAAGLCGFGGFFLGGMLTDRFLAKGRYDAPMLTPMLAMLVCTPAALAAALAPSPVVAILGMCVFVGLLMACSPGALAGLQIITPPAHRGRLNAIFVVIVNFVGVGLGPLLIGLFNDHLFVSKAAVHLSLAAMAAVLLPLGALFFYLARKPFGLAMRDAA